MATVYIAKCVMHVFCYVILCRTNLFSQYQKDW